MNWKTTAIVVCGAIGIGGCSKDETPSSQLVGPDGQQVVVRSASLEKDVYEGLYPNQHVTFVVTAYEAAVQQAVDRWNDAFADALSAPDLTVNEPGADVSLSFTFVEQYPNGTNWCGDEGTIYRIENVCTNFPQANVRSDLVDLLTHEIGNKIGWSDLESHPFLPNADSVLAHCVMYAANLNGSPCGYERQLLLHVHGTRDEVDMNSFMVAGATLIAFDDTVAVGDSVWVPIEYSPLDGGGAALEPPAAVPVYKPSWTADAPGILTFSGTTKHGAWVHAGPNAGSTIVRATLSRGSDPSVAWLAAGPVQASAAITVTAPPSSATPVHTIELSEDTVYLGWPNDPAQITVYAVARDINGTVIPDAVVTWSVTTEDIVYVDPQGPLEVLISNQNSGRTTLTASSGSAQSSGVRFYVDCSSGLCL